MFSGRTFDSTKYKRRKLKAQTALTAEGNRQVCLALGIGRWPIFGAWPMPV